MSSSLLEPVCQFGVAFLSEEAVFPFGVASFLEEVASQFETALWKEAALGEDSLDLGNLVWVFQV